MDASTFRSNEFDLAVDTISKEDVEALVTWLSEYPRLTMADTTRRFEEAWSKWQGVKYSVFCNSGSSANLLMYAALDESKRSGNRKIIVPSTGWVTTVSPAMQLGWTPIMCATDPDTFGMDATHLEQLCKEERPDAVILVHVLGTPNNMEPILNLQKEYGFQLIEDCCASHGARHQGALVGTFGAMSSFSFYYGHHMSTIEGGIVSTDDEELYFKLLMLRSHGWMKDLPKHEYDRLMNKYGIEDAHSPFTFVLPGYNLRSTDLSAYIGLLQMPKLDATVKRRVENHLRYQELLEGHFEFANCVPGDIISSISFCAVAQSAQQRKDIAEGLTRGGVDTRLFTAANLGRHPFWAERYGRFTSEVSDKLADGGFFLPNNQSLDTSDIDRVCEVLLGVLSQV